MKKKLAVILTILLVQAAALLQPSFCMAAQGLSDPAGAEKSASQDDAADLTVRIISAYDYDNIAKGGRYLPLHLDYTNGSPEDLTGYIHIYAGQSDGELYDYVYTVDIPGKGTSHGDYYIPIGIRTDILKLTLRDEAGTVRGRSSVRLNVDSNTAGLFIGVLSDTPERLEWLDGISVSNGLMRTEAFFLTPETFPDTFTALDPLDIMVISGFRIRNLSSEQSRALMDWVRNGGVMILGTGERVDDTLGRYAPELLDDMYEDPVPVMLDLGFAIEADAPGEAETELVCAEFQMHGGNVLTRSGDMAVLTGASKDHGQIVAAAMDFNDLAEQCRSYPELAETLITDSVGPDRLAELTREFYGTDDTKFRSVGRLTSTSDSSRIPPIRIYALAITAYILLVGPGLFIFLRQRELGSYYRAGVLLLSAAFTVVIYFMGTSTRFRDTFYNYATIVSCGEDSVGETTFLNLRDPYNRSYRVRLDGTYNVLPLTDAGEEASDHQEPGVSLTFSASDTEINVGDVGAFTPKYFELTKTEENTDGKGLSGYVQLFGGKVCGEITNDLGFDVRDAVIMYSGGIVKLGDIAAGETVDISGCENAAVPMGSSEKVSRYITGLDMFGASDSQKSGYMQALLETRVLSFYRDYYINGYMADCVVTAFEADGDDAGGKYRGNTGNSDGDRGGAAPEGGETDEGGRSHAVIKDDISGFGIRLFTSILPVDRMEDDREFRSALVRNPVAQSGKYDPVHNSVDAGDPIVLEYQLGNDLDITDILIERVDPVQLRLEASDSAVHDGTMSFYNYDTGLWDPADTAETSYTAGELSAYISPSNTFIVRYSSPSGDGAALPMISVIGTAK